MRALPTAARRRWAGAVLAVLVLVAGLAVSGTAFALVKDGEGRYASQTMDHYTDEIVESVADRVALYGATLTDLAYSVGAQTALSGDAFARISAGFDDVRLPGTAIVGFVVPATSGQVPDVQRSWRGRGAAGLTPAPDPGRPEHRFVIFEKVFGGWPAMSGSDLSSSSSATAVLHTARHSNALAISQAYPVAGGGDAIMLAAPVLTGLGSPTPDEFTGWVVMVLRAPDMLVPTLIERGHGTVHVTVTDQAGVVLASAAPGTRSQDGDLVRDEVLAVGQSRWQLTLWPTTRLDATADRGLSLLTLASGAALSVLLAAVLGVLAGSRNRALDQVERATVALRDDIDRRTRIEEQLREREDQLRELAFHDPLTGLANRMLFYDRLSHALHNHARSGKQVAVLFIDLDGFKQINDQRGHHAGDIVLRAVADRLRSGLRAGDTVARFGGDEFAIILESLTGPDHARAAATRVIEDVQQPIVIDGTAATVSASVGISVNSEGADADDIVRQADAAMYVAKSAGKNRYAEAGVTTS